MRRLFSLIVAIALSAIGAHAQTQPNAAAMPYVQIQFSSSAGAPLAAGKIYTYAAGSSTPLETYTTSCSGVALASCTQNTNPVILDSAGRANIYMGPNCYKFVAQNALSVQQWSVDNICDLALLLKTSFATKLDDNIAHCSQYAGTTMGDKIVACLAALTNGGTADARGFLSTQTTTVRISIGANKTLLLDVPVMTCTGVSSTECITLSGAGAQLISTNPNHTAIIQDAASAHQSIISITASNTTIDGINASGVVYAGDEAAEEIACFHVKPVTNPQVITGVTIKNSGCTGKTSGIWTYNGVLTTFQLTSSQFLNNILNTTYSGITIGGYLRAVYNKDILVKDNHSTVAVTSTFAGFYNARPCNSYNTDGMHWENNVCLGGFSGVEYLTSPRTPYAKDVTFIHNISDGHNGFTQIDGGTYSQNIVDMTLRDPAWITYDNAALVAVYGNMPGAEISDNVHISASDNHIRGQMGPCVDFGSSFSTFSGNNTMYDCSKAVNKHATWPSTSGCLELNNVITDSVVSGNEMDTCGTDGIHQVGTEVPTASISRTIISGNTIRNTPNHGIHIRSILDADISGNIISAVNTSATGKNGIDFTDDGGGATYQVSGITVNNNRIGNATALSGGAYCIYQPLVDAASNRLTYITYNKCQSPTTQAFKFWGHRKGNWNGTATGRRVITTSTVDGGGFFHIDLSDGLDSYDLDSTAAPFSVNYLDNVTENDELLFQMTVDADQVTLLNSTGRLQLAGGANYVPTTTSYIKFVIRSDASNVAVESDEISRVAR